MRVQYLLDLYPLLSESYIRTEIDFLRRSGCDVRVWARQRATAAYTSDVPVEYGDRPMRPILSNRPEIVHTHYLPNGQILAAEIRGVPLTVRGHVVDYDRDIAAQLVANPQVKRVFLFPHFAAHHDSRKVIPVTAAYDPERFAPAATKDWRLVVRAATGRSRKDLEGFIRVAAAMRAHFQFVMPITRPDDWAPYVDGLVKMNRDLGNPVALRFNQQYEDVAALVAQAGICLRSHDPTFHRYGMPVSVAEAMGAGCLILARDCAEARAYAGDAALYFGDDAGAISLLRDVAAWTTAQREAAQARALAQARKYAAPVVLQKIKDEWKALLA
ncbi:MAG: hypothetical protein ACRDZ4_08290 [Egibacteraceae bacterium]